MILPSLVVALGLAGGPKAGELEQLVEMAKAEACKVKTSHACASVNAFATGTAPDVKKRLLTIGLSEVAADETQKAYTVLSIEAEGVAEFAITPENEKEKKDLEAFAAAFAKGKSDPKSELAQLMESEAKKQPRLKVIPDGTAIAYQHNRPLGGRWVRQNGKKLYLLGIGGGLERPGIVVTELPDPR